MTADLEKLRDELAQEIVTDNCAWSSGSEEWQFGVDMFYEGFNAALSHLSAQVEFDEAAANAKGYEHSEESWQYFSEGARWQFDRMAARVGLAEERLRGCEAHLLGANQSIVLTQARLAESKDEYDDCRDSLIAMTSSRDELEAKLAAAEARVRELESELENWRASCPI